MNRPDDPYDRLATLLWMLQPADVARLVAVADLLVEMRLQVVASGTDEGDRRAAD